MGFKVDSSFLKFLTMGALASKRVMELMTASGLRPIELERYCTSNKIWATKVKRLRLPDLLCVSTGLRVEVRAKTDLAIRMSDAPTSPDRRWSSSVKPTDMVAFVRCIDDGAGLVAARTAELFWVQDLLNSEGTSKLGAPKSADEGSERDRTWKTIVPRRSGRVINVDKDSIKTVMDDGKGHTYRLGGLHCYVQKDHRFLAEGEFIAGTPARKASFQEVVGRRWDPRTLMSGDEVDRYVAAKSLGVVGNQDDLLLLRGLFADPDPRVALEAAGSMAKLGDQRGIACIMDVLEHPARPYLPMEAVFLLSELRGSALQTLAQDQLLSIARRAEFVDNEVRQAAIWGLGRAAHGAYDLLIDFLDAENMDERLHALVAFSPTLPEPTIHRLVAVLADDASAAKKSAACHILGNLTEHTVAVQELLALAKEQDGEKRSWARAALGLMPADVVEREPELARDLRPLHLLSGDSNWTRQGEVQDALRSLTKQAALL